jgi:hypothetical protein
MKLGLIFVLFFLIIITANVSAMNYPQPFIEFNKTADVAIIYSNDAPTYELVAAADISSNLAVEMVVINNCTSASGSVCPSWAEPRYVLPNSTNTVIFSDTESGFENKNVISLGILCDNKISNTLMQLNSNCSNLEEKIGF